jgi:hypothetical protein
MGASKRVCVKRFTRRSSSALGVIGRQPDFRAFASGRLAQSDTGQRQGQIRKPAIPSIEPSVLGGPR